MYTSMELVIWFHCSFSSLIFSLFQHLQFQNSLGTSYSKQNSSIIQYIIFRHLQSRCGWESHLPPPLNTSGATVASTICFQQLSTNKCPIGLTQMFGLRTWHRVSNWMCLITDGGLVHLVLLSMSQPFESLSVSFPNSLNCSILTMYDNYFVDSVIKILYDIFFKRNN